MNAKVQKAKVRKDIAQQQQDESFVFGELEMLASNISELLPENHQINPQKFKDVFSLHKKLIDALDDLDILQLQDVSIEFFIKNYKTLLSLDNTLQSFQALSGKYQKLKGSSKPVFLDNEKVTVEKGIEQLSQELIGKIKNLKNLRGKYSPYITEIISPLDKRKETLEREFSQAFRFSKSLESLTEKLDENIKQLHNEVENEIEYARFVDKTSKNNSYINEFNSSILNTLNEKFRSMHTLLTTLLSKVATNNNIIIESYRKNKDNPKYLDSKTIDDLTNHVAGFNFYFYLDSVSEKLLYLYNLFIQYAESEINDQGKPKAFCTIFQKKDRDALESVAQAALQSLDTRLTLEINTRNHLEDCLKKSEREFNSALSLLGGGARLSTEGTHDSGVQRLYSKIPGHKELNFSDDQAVKNALNQLSIFQRYRYLISHSFRSIFKSKEEQNKILLRSVQRYYLFENLIPSLNVRSEGELQLNELEELVQKIEMLINKIGDNTLDDQWKGFQKKYEACLKTREELSRYSSDHGERIKRIDEIVQLQNSLKQSLNKHKHTKSLNERLLQINGNMEENCESALPVKTSGEIMQGSENSCWTSFFNRLVETFSEGVKQVINPQSNNKDNYVHHRS
jgi:hypothetical protein